MFCFSASLYSRDFVDMFPIRMLCFLWSVFPENCAVRLECSFKKFFFPDQVEAIWSPRQKKHHIMLLFLSYFYRTGLIQHDAGSLQGEVTLFISVKSGIVRISLAESTYTKGPLQTYRPNSEFLLVSYPIPWFS